MSQTPKHGLGRGLTALIPENFDDTLLLDESERVHKLAVDVVVPHADQPRRHFDNDLLRELADSIKMHGILQPIVVTPLSDGKHRIVAGERRWRAAKTAGLKSIPAIIRSLEELEQLELALVENIQRVDLSALEQAMSLHKLHHQFSTPYEKIAKRLGKASSTVNNIVRLLQLPPPAQKALAERKISEGHARAILALKDHPDQQAYLLKAIMANGWSVREAERYVTSHKHGVRDKRAARARVRTETPATRALSKKLGTAVSIRRTAKGGKLEISFKSDEELKRLLGLFD